MKYRVPTSLFALMALLCWSSCQKPAVDLKSPTQLGIRLGLGTDYLPPADGLTLTEGYLRVTSIELKGSRVMGAPFAFKRKFPDGIHVPFNVPNALVELVFDVPKGDYNKLVAILEVEAQATRPTLWVEGTYTWAPPLNASAVVQAQWRRACRFEVNLLGTGGHRTLDEQPTAPQLLFQPYAWFADTDVIKWNHAYYFTTSKGRIMPINAQYNNDLFIVADRVLGNLLTTQW